MDTKRGRKVGSTSWGHKSGARAGDPGGHCYRSPVGRARVVLRKNIENPLSHSLFGETSRVSHSLLVGGSLHTRAWEVGSKGKAEVITIGELHRARLFFRLQIACCITITVPLTMKQHHCLVQQQRRCQLMLPCATCRALACEPHWHPVHKYKRRTTLTKRHR